MYELNSPRRRALANAGHGKHWSGGTSNPHPDYVGHHRPEVISEYWPVCICADCTRCGCNNPWMHHSNPTQVTQQIGYA